MLNAGLFFISYMCYHIILLAVLQLSSGMVTLISQYCYGFFLLQLQILFGLCGRFVQGLAIIGIGSLSMNNQVMFIIYRILCVVGYFHNIFYDDNATAIGIGSAYLLIIRI